MIPIAGRAARRFSRVPAPRPRSLFHRLAPALACALPCLIAFAQTLPRRTAMPGQGFSEDQPGRPGYLMDCALIGGKTVLLGAAEIENYSEGKHLVADDDWIVFLLDGRGEGIGTRRIGNPGRFSPILSAEQAAPFAVRIPRLSGLASVVLLDQFLEERMRIAVDARFRTEAAASRQRFLAHERENRRLLSGGAGVRAPVLGQVAPSPKDPILLESLPEDLQKQIRGEVAREMEGIEQYGPGITELRRLAGAGPEEAEGIAGNASWILAAAPSVRLSGTVTNAQGQGIGGAVVQVYAKDLQSYFNATSQASGRFSTDVPAGRPLNISLSPPLPYIAPLAELGVVLTEDTVRDFRLETGWRITGRVLDEGNAPLNRASVLLRQLASSSTWSPTWASTTSANGQFTFAVPKNLSPNSFVLAAYATNYMLQSVGLSVTQDAVWDLQLARGHTVTGVVRDSNERLLQGARVRAFQGGNLAGSALTTSTGSYSFNLPAGVFDIDVLPPAGSSMAAATAKAVEVNGPRTADVVLQPAAGILTVRLYYPSEQAYNRLLNRFVRFELYRSGLTAYAGSGTAAAGGFDPSRGKYYASRILYLNNGSYSLTALVAGCTPVKAADVAVSGASMVALDLPEPFLWTGVLRGADGQPMPGTNIQSYSDLVRDNELTATNAAGQFSILMTPNGFVKFFTASAGNSILHTERFGNQIEGRSADLTLDAFPEFTDSGSVLTQIYGVPDRYSRWNIVMIGDGYTGVNETFTDQNGNGRWDGVVYYDMNKNGVWDTGEPNQRYGNAAAPVSGTDPSRTNEPFNDTNGDGFPSLHDQELFSQNTLDTARSLFGQDLWRKYRSVFNIFRIRLVSNQAGHSIRDESNRVVIQRDTALGTYLHTPSRSYLFSANYTLVSQYINQYVPECDTRIVMVNQPVRMGRVNSYMFQYGGEVPTLANDYVVAHEMGHNVGLLADEYTEYQETYAGPETASRNITSLVDPRHIPWRHMFSPGKEIPSLPLSGGVGLFDGSAYYTGGRYRPTEFCMMVSGNRYCPVCTAEVETRIRDITGVVPEAVPRGPVSTVTGLYPTFSWDAPAGASHFLIEVETADGSRLVGSYDVYGTSLVLPAALSAETEYRWRVRAATTSRWGTWSSWTYFRPQSQAPLFTGIFAQIAAGGGYETALTAINTGSANADALVTLIRSDGTPFDAFPAAPGDPLHLSLKPLGTARLQALLPGSTVAGYARLEGYAALDGTALFRVVRNNRVQSQAGVGLSRRTRTFTVYLDNTDNASSGYAVANFGGAPVTLNLTLRDHAGIPRGSSSLELGPRQHKAEFASERFASAAAGFEGSIDFAADQEVAAVALRFDNVHMAAESQVFSTTPVLADEASATLFFPQLADGGGYRTHFLFLNPSPEAATVRLEFYSSAGAPLDLPIGGVRSASHDLLLSGRGVARVLTDGAAADVRIGWARATSPVAIGGSAIFQRRDSRRILAEAGVASSAPASRFVTCVESLGPAESGIAICNPNQADVTMTLNLRRSTGEIAATATLVLPAFGHMARFFTELFPRGFGEFEGTVEGIATAPVSAVALRFDNPALDVFATLPVIVLQR